MDLACPDNCDTKTFVKEETVKWEVTPAVEELRHLETCEIRYFCPICGSEAEDSGAENEIDPVIFLLN